jgi:hypothetical protein
LTGARDFATMRAMIEIISFLLGLGFSLYVAIRSIRPLDHPWKQKIVYFIFTLIGITGTIFLSGILAAHFLRKWAIIPVL